MFLHKPAFCSECMGTCMCVCSLSHILEYKCAHGAARLCACACGSVCVCLPAFRSLSHFVCLSVCLTVFLSVCLSNCLSVCLSGWLAGCMFVCCVLCMRCVHVPVSVCGPVRVSLEIGLVFNTLYIGIQVHWLALCRTTLLFGDRVLVSLYNTCRARVARV